MKGRDRLLTLIVVLAFLWAGFTQWLRLEPVLGAFAIGILFGQMRRLPSDVSHKLEGGRPGHLLTRSSLRSPA